MVPRVCLQFVIVVFSDHIHLLLFCVLAFLFSLQVSVLNGWPFVTVCSDTEDSFWNWACSEQKIVSSTHNV